MEGYYTFSGCTSLKSVEYLGDNSTGINLTGNDLFGAGASSPYPASTPQNLYLPNVASDQHIIGKQMVRLTIIQKCLNKIGDFK